MDHACIVLEQEWEPSESCHLPCKDGNVWFTLVPLKALSINCQWIRYLFLKSLKVFSKCTHLNLEKQHYLLHYWWARYKFKGYLCELDLILLSNKD